MAGGGNAFLAEATSDADDRLVSAQEPLGNLQRSCGGELPGTIAVPELLSFVRQVRLTGNTYSGSFSAQDGNTAVTARVEITPDETGGGCLIQVSSWQVDALQPATSQEVADRKTQIQRHLAELSCWLDKGQRILAVTGDCSELSDLQKRMENGLGRHWTDFLQPEGWSEEFHPDWRELNGNQVEVAGSPRTWRVAILPLALFGNEPSGFQLLLIADEPVAGRYRPGFRRPAPARLGHIGRDLAPGLATPISRIITNADMIRMRLAGPLPDAYVDYASDIAGAGKLLLDLLSDLSDLEVVEAGDFGTAPDRIDLAEVAQQAAGILSVRAREKGIVIEVPRREERLPAIAEFRRALQIVLNLVGNAIRYSPEDSRILLEVQREGGRARVIVIDQGPGLSDEQQKVVFDKFERLGRSGDGGSGLGLYIARRLARAMSGDLRVESIEGNGARFILELPADDGPDELSAARENGPARSRRVQQRRAQRRSQPTFGRRA